MKEVSIYNAPIGSLISWTNYANSPAIKHVGILVRTADTCRRTNGMIEVITNGERQCWFGWQCEVIA